MKRLLLTALSPVLFFAAQAQGKPEVRVQGQEQIILKKDPGQQTVIEIKNGKVFIDGDEIASADDTRSGQFSKKIIIEGSGRAGGSPDLGSAGEMPEGFDELLKLFGGGADSAFAPKPLLGVRAMAADANGGKGALLDEVSAGSPAEKAGLMAGDIITAIDGKPIADGAALTAAVLTHQPGDEIAIRYKRGKAEKTAKATLDAAPGNPYGSIFGDDNGSDGADAMPNPFGGGGPFADMMRGMGGDAPKLGLTAENATGDEPAVRIAEVDPGGAAAKAGLQQGDLITSVGNTRITNMDALEMALSNSRGKDALQVDYTRNGRKATAQVVVKEEKKRRQF